MESNSKFEILEYSDFGWGESTLAQFKYRNEIIFKYINQNETEITSYTLLDLGSGEGNLANLLSTIFKEVICIDADKKSIVKGQRKYPNITFYHSNMSEYPDVNYDMISIIGAIYYCSDDEINILGKKIAGNKRVIIDCLNEHRLSIFRSCGFTVEHVYKYYRPKHKTSFLIKILIPYYTLVAFKENIKNEKIIEFIDKNKYKREIYFLINKVPFIIFMAKPIVFLLKKIAASVFIYKILLIFGKEEQNIYVLNKKQKSPATNKV